MFEQISVRERDYWGDVLAARPNALLDSLTTRSKAELGRKISLRYGPAERQEIDLFVPEGTESPIPLLLFIHGGFWQVGSKDSVAFPARFWNAKGIAYATLGYRLVPDAPLKDTIGDARLGLEVLAREAKAFGLDARRIAVAGHSAGAHLAAMLVAGQEQPSVRALCLLSGVFDLRELRDTTPGRVLSAEDVGGLASGPLGYPPAAVPALIAYGADETPGFARQSKRLAEHWGTGKPTALPSREHYSVLLELEDQESPVARFLSAQLGRPK
jgi:arylformamidase